MHERRDAADFFKAVDGRDVGMIQRGEHLRFALEAGQPIGDPRAKARAGS